MVANLPANVKVGVINFSVSAIRIELFDNDNYKAYVSTITEDWMKERIAAYGGNHYSHLVEMAKLARKDGVIKGCHYNHWKIFSTYAIMLENN